MTAKPMRQLFDAMHHGKYDFEDFLSCDIKSLYKRVDWRQREIYKPSRKLKAYHAFLIIFLLEHLPLNVQVSFAYRKGSNPHQAVLPHANSRAFYQTDLTKFFDSITSPLIRRVLCGAPTPVADLESYIDRVIELLTVNSRLPIGFSTSTWISNACLKSFDDSFEAVCRDRRLIYSRYADDLIISGQSVEQLAGIDKILSELLLSELGPEFKINSKKSKLTRIGRKVAILGMVILPSGQVAIDMEVKKKIEYQLHFYIKDRERLLEFFEQEKDDMETGLERLAGHISHVNTADPAYLDKLRKKYGSTVIDSFLHRSAQ